MIDAAELTDNDFLRQLGFQTKTLKKSF